MQNILESAEFKELFSKHLSAENNGLLTDLLKQATKDAETVKEQEKKISELNELNIQLSNDLSKHKSFTEREEKLQQAQDALDAREQTVKELEIKQQVSQLTYELQAEKDKTTFAQSVALGLVRNTEYRKNVFDGESHHTPGHTCPHTGNWVNPATSNTTKTYTEHETKE